MNEVASASSICIAAIFTFFESRAALNTKKYKNAAFLAFLERRKKGRGQTCAKTKRPPRQGHFLKAHPSLLLLLRKQISLFIEIRHFWQRIPLSKCGAKGQSDSHVNNLSQFTLQ